MKKFILSVFLAAAATPVVAAPEDYIRLPIEQREAAPAEVDYPQAVQYQAPVQQSPQYNQSVQPSQPAVAADVQWELYNQIQQMQQELSELRGLVEQQAHELTQLKQQQRQRYLDLDYRLNQIKSSASAPEASAVAESSTQQPAVVVAAGDDKKIYDQALELIRKDRKYQEAIGMLEGLLESSPQSEWAPSSMYWLASIYMLIDPPDYDKAKSHLITLLKDHKDHQKFPDALLKLGKLYSQLGDKDKARITLQKVIADYPKREAANHARKLLKQL